MGFAKPKEWATDLRLDHEGVPERWKTGKGRRLRALNLRNLAQRLSSISVGTLTSDRRTRAWTFDCVKQNISLI